MKTQWRFYVALKMTKGGGLRKAPKILRNFDTNKFITDQIISNPYRVSDFHLKTNTLSP